MTLKESVIAISLLQRAQDALDKKKHRKLADLIGSFLEHLEGSESPWRVKEVN